MSKILIVDDSPDMLTVFNWLLHKRGYDCVTTYYKKGIFNQLAKFTPSLIILDVNLIGEDGREICMEIKSNPETKKVPVIICSGNHDLLANYEEYLADDYLEKPFEINTVIKKIEHVLNKQKVVS
ncbi:MAG: response regulator [Ferruginibacter sp.]